MEILKFPNPILFKICTEVTVFGPELKVILDNMWDTMITANGMGLAANQVGLLYRMFTMEGPEKERIYIVNPKILKYSNLPCNLAEGCLSATGELLKLGRPLWTELTYQDENGEIKTRVFKDIWSVCVNHEIEHLNGESFLESKKIPKEIRKKLAKKYKIK